MGTDIATHASEAPGVEIRMIARLKHGGIARAAEKCGSLKKLAKYLGVGYQAVCSWGALRTCPPTRPEHLPINHRWTKEKIAEVDAKFRSLIGQSLEDLFPDKLRAAKDWRKAPKTFERTTVIAPEELLQLSDRRQAYDLEDAAEAMDRELLRERLNEQLGSLSYRERKIIELRYGLEDGVNYTLEEVGYIFKVSRDRVRQIEAKAIRKLQQPKRAAELLPFVEPAPDKTQVDISPLSDEHPSRKKLKEAITA